MSEPPYELTERAEVRRSRVRERQRRRERAFAWPRWLGEFAQDFGVTTAVVVVYFVLRGIAPERVDFAVRFGAGLMQAQQALGIWWEPHIQEWTIRGRVVMELANFIYAYLHFPALIGVGVWLWFANRPGFWRVRTALFVSMPIGLLCYYAFPAAPPRLLPAFGYDVAIRDTVFGPGTVVSYDQPWFFKNDWAAIPSFHYGWMQLVTMAMWAYSRNVWVRLGGVALLVAMTWAILATGNHFILDAVAGGLVIWVAWAVAGGWERRRSTRTPLPRR